jgi:hypothetical protein
MILDEIFDSSLDNQGTDDFFKIIKSMSNEKYFLLYHTKVIYCLINSQT